MRGLVQLTLDFLGLEMPAPAPSGPATGVAVLPKPVPEPAVLPVTPRRQRRAAPPPAPPVANDPVFPLAQWRHPRANRELQLGHCLVGYEFRRARRRTIGFVIGPEGLVVSAPRWVPLHEVEAALIDKAPWIVRKLGEVQERQRRAEATQIVWADGARFPFLGELVTLVLDGRHGFDAVGAVLRNEPDPLTGVDRLTLQVGLPQTASVPQIRDAVQAWLMRQARRIFEERLNHFAPQLQVRWRKLSLSSAGTRWGSARNDGSIRLNWRLVHVRLSLIDYVVVHELSHLRVMDHSPRFWETVGTVLPDYAERRGQLRDDAIPRWV